MRLRHDQVILLLTVVLVVIGLGMVLSASYDLARSRFGDPFFFLKRQLVRAALGLALLLVVSQIDYRNWRRVARLGLLLATLSLGLVFLFEEVRGTRGWVQIGAHTFQPVECARVALLFFLAAEIARLGSRIRDLRHGFLPLGAAVSVVLLLVVKQPDFGSALALGLLSLTLLFAGGVRWAHLLGSGSVILGSAVWMASRKPHVQDRLLGFLHPTAHASDEAYQSLQSVLSIASGGPVGKGLGQGFAKYGYLPDPHTDFIFSVMGEELGFVGCAAILGLFLLLVGRAIRVARQHEDPFATLLALGIGMSIFWYVALHVLVALRMMPVTGLPLPLVSYGGSSLVTHLFALGVLRNVARGIDPPRRGRTRWAVTRPTPGGPPI